MKRSVWFLVSISFCLWCGPALAQPDLEVCSTPLSPISSTLPPVVDTIDVTDDQAIADAHIFVDITHTFIGDLEITVTSPALTTVTLTDNSGGSINDILTTFNDQGILFDGAQMPDGLNMQPQGPGLMADFAGQTTLGLWSLSVNDTLGGDDGTLDEWCLRSFLTVPPPPPQPVQNLLCTPNGATGTVAMSWTNPMTYDSFDVYVNGVLEATLAGTATSYDTAPLPVPSNVDVCVEGFVGGLSGGFACCNVDLIIDPQTGLTCTITPSTGTVDLSWINGLAYDNVNVYLDGALVATLPGTATTYTTDPQPIPSSHTICVEGEISGVGTSVQICCTVTFFAAADVEACAFPAAPISNTLPPVFSFIDVPDTLTIADMQVRVRITHTWVGDLDIDIASPASTTVRLHDGGGGSSDNLDVMYWELGVPNGSPYDCACTMQPSGPGSLFDFVGQEIQGSWLLSVADNVGGDDGTLDEWCVRGFINGPPLPVENLACNPDGVNAVVDVAWDNPTPYDQIEVFVNGTLEATLPGTDTSYTTSTQPINSVVTVSVQPSAGGIVPQPTECSTWLIGPADVEGCAFPNEPVSSTLPPVISTIDVPTSLIMGDVQVKVMLTHTFEGDLEIDVASPALTSVRLHDHGGGSANNINVLYWSLGLPNGTPYDCFCEMQPSGPGALFDFFGEEIQGAWTLTVADTIGGDSGTLHEWCVRGFVTGPPAPVDNVACNHINPGIVDVTWDNQGAYDAINVYVNGLLESTLAGTATSYSTQPMAVPSTAEICIEPEVGGTPTAQRCCTIDLIMNPVSALACSSAPASGVVDATWVNGMAYDSINVYVNGGLAATLPGTATTYSTDPQPIPSSVTICVEGEITGVGISAQECCTVTVLGPPGSNDVIFAGEQPSDIDSVTALQNALIANGRDVVVVFSLDVGAVGVPAILWLALGTYPDDHDLTADEGDFLSSLAAAGVPIYVEGGDTWAFNTQTSFENYDGVENDSFGNLEDGDDSLTFLTGLDSTFGLDMTGLDAVYNQDQSGNDWTDRLQPCDLNPDLGGPNSGVVWTGDDAGVIYNVGIFYDSTFAPVIAQTWEFGGYAGDQNALAGLYIAALGATITPPGDEFVRGDVNADGQVNIGDPVSLLSALFVPGAAQPVCDDAADINADGQLNVGDPVYGLSALFVPGSPPPPAPFPDCGEDPDPTGNTLECGAFDPCP